VDELEPREGFSTAPLRDCGGFQLKLPDRRLLADDGLDAGGVGRGSSFLGDWLGTGNRWSLASRSAATWGASTGDWSLCSEDPDERLLIPESADAVDVARRLFGKCSSEWDGRRSEPEKTLMAGDSVWSCAGGPEGFSQKAKRREMDRDSREENTRKENYY